MDMELSEDQRMLKEMVDRFVTDRYGFEARQAIVHSPEGWSRPAWCDLGKLGLLMIPVAEEDGGMGGGGVETMIVGEALGRVLSVEPWLPTLLATAIIQHADERLRAELLPKLMSGEWLFALAGDADAVSSNGRISGSAHRVLGAGQADRIFVRATTADGASCVLMIDAAEQGVRRDDYALHGGGRAADIILDDAPVLTEVLLGARVEEALRAAHASGVAAVAADALGAAQAAFDLTIEYLKTREQFGQPIGVNQALQHRAAEMFVELEQLRSAAILAACTLGEENETERDRISAAVRIVTAKTARFIGQQIVQLHGGIGVTDESAIGHYFLRLTAATILFGDADHNIGRLADIGGFVAAAPYWEAA